MSEGPETTSKLRLECAPCQASAGSGCLLCQLVDSTKKHNIPKLSGASDPAHWRSSASSCQYTLPFHRVPRCALRSKIPEEALRTVIDSLGVIGWARCAAFLNKELAALVPQDIVISVGDFSPKSHTYREVRSKLGQACWSASLHLLLQKGSIAACGCFSTCPVCNLRRLVSAMLFIDKYKRTTTWRQSCSA